MPLSKTYDTLLVSRDDNGHALTVTLNRPDLHNAFNEALIADLRDLCARLTGAGPSAARVVVLTGAGPSFCAGADINWMSKQRAYTREQNLADARELGAMFLDWYRLPMPTIARVNGAAIGGGCGLVAACDIAVAADTAKLGLSEVKIGIIPAVIAPYVIRKIGERGAREFMLTGERVDGARAEAIGLVNRAVAHTRLDAEVARYVEALVTSGPAAVAACKRLIEAVAPLAPEAATDITTQMIADIRISDEGQEGMASFLEKRKPNWTD